MEWMVTNPRVHSTLSLLGSRVGETYLASDGCLDNLEELYKSLQSENCVQRQFRRSIGFSQVVKKDLLPLLSSANNNSKIVDAVVRILVNLTFPVECLVDVDSLLRTDNGRTVIYELNWLLTSCKEAFIDPRSTRAVLDYIKSVIDNEDHLTTMECEGINNCLLLLRNILHIPEVRGGVPGNGVSHQNQIIWNLFTQNLDKVLIHLMTGSNRSQWGVSVVQLIALLYKDQHVITLQKLLNLWFEASLSESSEDNESNTSPPDFIAAMDQLSLELSSRDWVALTELKNESILKATNFLRDFVKDQGSGDSSSSMIMSDPMSDSSDNGGNSNPQRKISKTEGNEILKSCLDNKQIHKVNRMTDRKNHSTIRKHFPNKSQNKKERMVEGGESSSSGFFDVASHNSMWSWTSSDGGAALSMSKKECVSELSDCGYGTQVENQESVSTSSNDDDAPSRNMKPVHQKPSHMIQKPRYSAGKPMLLQERKEWRRKKLMKRSRTNIMNMKALLHHSPSDEDISHLLKEFTVDFLLKGYACLVQELQTQLLTNFRPSMDTSHFFWLLTYFLKFAAQLELDFKHISPVLSFDIVSYLTFEGVHLCEELELARLQSGYGSALTTCLRRMHLVVTALREIIQAIEMYKKIPYLSQEDEQHILCLQNKLCSVEDLKCLFVLLLRNFDPAIQSKQYLQDIIITNHIFLIFLENYNKTSNDAMKNVHKTSMADHISMFASKEIMKQYGLLLECFEENGEFVNNCILTMMHHIAGDINQAETLFQPSILKTFFRIWESDFEICEDWSDLIEYIVHKFINMKHSLPEALSEDRSRFNQPSDPKEALPITGWSVNDSRNLHWYFVQSEKSSDPIGKVLAHYTESGVLNKTRIGVIEQLLKQEEINDSQFDAFMKKEPDDDFEEKKKTKKDSPVEAESVDEIKTVRDHLVNEKKGKFVMWLKKCLLEACHVKLCLAGKASGVMEPISYHCALMNKPIPFVPWSVEQANILQYQPFELLLHKLRMCLPSKTGTVYARLPDDCSAEGLYSSAELLGPISPDEIKFDLSALQMEDVMLWKQDLKPSSSSSRSGLFNISGSKRSHSFISFTPEPDLKSNWRNVVKLSKTVTATAAGTPEMPSFPEENEMACENGDTDLTGMCVSDEELAANIEMST